MYIIETFIEAIAEMIKTYAFCSSSLRYFQKQLLQRTFELKLKNVPFFIFTFPSKFVSPRTRPVPTSVAAPDSSSPGSQRGGAGPGQEGEPESPHPRDEGPDGAGGDQSYAEPRPL